MGGERLDTGGAIEVESYDHRGHGEGHVEYFDHSTGEYRSGYMDLHPGRGDVVPGEITDETGETFEIEMRQR